MHATPSRRDVLKTSGLLAGGALAAATLGAGPAAAARPTAAPGFTVLTAAKKVAARSDRRPVAGGVCDPVAGRTFLSWAGRNEDTYVQSYDHATGAFSAPLLVLSGRGDTHNYPTMVQAADGHLLIFVGMHNVELVMARSARPHAIDGAWTVRTIPEGRAASYPMPFRATNGDLFVFFRETTHRIGRVSRSTLGPCCMCARPTTGRPGAVPRN